MLALVAAVVTAYSCSGEDAPELVAAPPVASAPDPAPEAPAPALPASAADFSARQAVMTVPAIGGPCPATAVLNMRASIERVWFAQTHLMETNWPFFYLLEGRPTLVKLDVSAPAGSPVPTIAVTATFADGDTKRLCLRPPTSVPTRVDLLPQPLLQDLDSSFVATLPASWLQQGASFRFGDAGGPSVTKSAAELRIASQPEFNLVLADVLLFGDAVPVPRNKDFDAELASKLPVSRLTIQSLPYTVAYKTFGTLNAHKSNVIVYPTSYSAQHLDTQFMVGDGAALDASRYFIIIPNLFGNGLSSSPSNTPWPDVGTRYPDVTYFDAVQVQRRLLAEVFGIHKVALVYGWSMGAMQAYHWAAMFPDMVERIAVVCGSARCAPHNQVFIEGAKHALMADPAYRDGVFTERPVRGFRAMGRVYAGWALSQTFYRQELWRGLGFTSLEDFLVRSWEAGFVRRDMGDLLAQLWTWQHADISANDLFRGDLEMALASIKARVLLMPSATDLYFQTDDNRGELPHLKQATLVEIPSIWGHRAGNPWANPEDAAFLDAQVTALLES